MPAIILQNPRSPVKFDALPQTRESILDAFRFNCTAREDAGLPMLPLPADVVPSELYQPEDMTAEQLAVADATDGLYRLIVAHSAPLVYGWVSGSVLVPRPPAGIAPLVQWYGMERVQRWVRNLAPLAGQPLEMSVYDERPADRCLADGCALVNSVCVRCGRDNS